MLSSGAQWILTFVSIVFWLNYGFTHCDGLSIDQLSTTRDIINIDRESSSNDEFNFTCSGYFMKNLTCSWNQQNYNIDTYYELHLMTLMNVSYATCSTKFTRKNFCTFDTSQLPSDLIDDQKFKFLLNVTNKFESVNKIFEIDHYANVIPGPVFNVRPVSIGASYVYLKWDKSKEMIDKPHLEKFLQYYIKIYPVLTSEQKIDKSRLLNYPIDTNHSQLVTLNYTREYNITNLSPDSYYRIEITCRFVNSKGKSPWSDLFIGFIETKPVIPYLYPMLNPEAFEVIPKSVTSQDVIIYFDKVNRTSVELSYILRVAPIFIAPIKPLNMKNDTNDSIQMNLPIGSSSESVVPTQPDDTISLLELEADILPCRLSLTEKGQNFVSELILSIKSSYCIIENLNKSTDYQVMMLSYNSMVIQSAKKFMIIPAKTLNLIHPGVDQFYAINWIDNVYTLYWKVSSATTIHRFKIFWCQVTHSNKKCDHYIDYVSLSADKRSIELPIDLDGIQFGISVIDTTYGLSSGIKWTSCIEKESFIPINDRFQKFDVTKTGPKSIRANWRLDCPALDHFIDHYELRYCRTDYPCTETLTIIYIVNSTEHNIEKLDSYTGYNMTIRAVTTRGEILESPTITIETEVNVISFTLIISIVIAGIITMSTILYSLIVCTIKKRSDEKKLKQSVDSNWVPKMPPRLKGDGNLLFDTLPQRERDISIGPNAVQLNNKDAIKKLTLLDQHSNDHNTNFPSAISEFENNKSHATIQASEEPEDGFELRTIINDKEDDSNTFNQNESSSSAMERKSRQLFKGCESEDSGYSKGDSTIDTNCDKKLTNLTNGKILNNKNYVTINDTLDP